MVEGWVSACPPGEFEPQSAMMLGLTELLPFCPQVAVPVIAELIDRMAIIGIVHSEEQRRQALALLCDWGIPAHRIHFVCMPVHGMWVRDYGPSFVRWSDGQVVILDAEYAQPDRRNDDVVPSFLASLLRLNVVRVPLAVEGGILIGNGEGLCLTTTAILRHNAHHDYRLPVIRTMLEQYYGYFTGVTLTPLKGDPSGHVDLFATFVSPTTVVVGQCDPAVDPENAEILDANARILEQVPTRTGRLRVVRIPMPPSFQRTVNGRTVRMFPSYTNVIFGNGKLLVPVYPDIDRRLDHQALAVYRELLPGGQVVGIDASGMVAQGGTLHCVSLNIPWLEDRFEMPPRAAEVLTSLAASA